jgi:hypothetical protein
LESTNAIQVGQRIFRDIQNGEAQQRDLGVGNEVILDGGSLACSPFSLTNKTLNPDRFYSSTTVSNSGLASTHLFKYIQPNPTLWYTPAPCSLPVLGTITHQFAVRVEVAHASKVFPKFLTAHGMWWSVLSVGNMRKRNSEVGVVWALFNMLDVCPSR